MRLTVHDVGHGQCISLIHENGNVMLWDCGHDGDNRPSAFMPQTGNKRIDYFFVTNYDEDHISDLNLLRQTCLINHLVRNKSISSAELYALKRLNGPVTGNMEAMIDMMDTYTLGPLNPGPEFPGVSFETFHNNYGEEYPDTNNISLVTFLTCNDVTFIIPGDVENKGWQGLLKINAFLQKLRNVNVFIAGHHGRDSGYCKEVFNYCKPGYFVFSDGPIKHATQEMADVYGAHARGIEFNGKHRSVLTTRNDGDLYWDL